MKVKGLDGRIYTWTLTGSSPDRPVSKPHLATRLFLKTLFPSDQVVEELVLPGSGSLRVDFFLPKRKLIVEIDGRQHTEFVAHFHGDRFKFAKSLQRDRRKREWVELNGFSFARLDEKGTEIEWREIILGAFAKSLG